MAAVVKTERRVTSKAVVAAARKYCGVPVIEGGRDRTVGVDCVGLVLGVAHDLKLTFPADIQGYGLSLHRHPREAEAKALLRQYMICVADKALDGESVLPLARVGDVLFFEVLGRALSLAIVTETKPTVYIYDWHPVIIPISKVVGGLHELGDSFQEYAFTLTWGCAASAVFRFRELAEKS